jgi:hypothetical protein
VAETEPGEPEEEEEEMKWEGSTGRPLIVRFGAARVKVWLMYYLESERESGCVLISLVIVTNEGIIMIGKERRKNQRKKRLVFYI